MEKFAYGGEVPESSMYPLLLGEKLVSKKEWWKNSDLSVCKIFKGGSIRMNSNENESGSKYLKRIVLAGPPVITEDLYYDGLVDVYAVIDAFNVTCPARAHAIKKLLCVRVNVVEKTRYRTLKSQRMLLLGHMIWRRQGFAWPNDKGGLPELGNGPDC